MLIPIAAVLATIPLSGEVPVTGGDYLDVPFEVPAGTKELQITHDDGSTFVILDWGVWSPTGFRGWGGGNSEPITIGETESSRSYLPGPIEAGTWHLVIGKAQLGASGNMYTATVTCHDTTSLLPRPRAAYAAPVLATERRWYAGDFHVHSTESGDARATFAQIAALARTQRLDFVNFSDHNTSSAHALLAAFQAMQPDLLLLRGAEITTYNGHANSVGVPSYVDHRIGFAGRTIVDVIDEVTAAGGAFIINHPVLDLGDICIGCAWKHGDTPWDKVDALELITGNFDISVNAFVPRVVELWETQLDAGFPLAVVGGSDDHAAGTATGATDSPIGSPTTLVLADNLSEAAIIAGIKAGRTMVKLRGPDDPDLEALLEAKGSLAEIGDTVLGIAEVRIAAKVAHGAGSFIQLWRDGESLGSTAITSDEFSTVLTDTPGAGRHRYRVEIENDVGQRVVVTSHWYVDAIAADEGCGCRTARPASGLPMLLVALALRRRRPTRSRTRSRACAGDTSSSASSR